MTVSIQLAMLQGCYNRTSSFAYDGAEGGGVAVCGNFFETSLSQVDLRVSGYPR
jgi:hypothetical protein